MSLTFMERLFILLVERNPEVILALKKYFNYNLGPLLPAGLRT